jgi:hypothetical protein
MKIITPLFITIAIGLIIYNSTFLNFENIFQGESQIAFIGILASACVIVLLLILRTSLTIEKKSK